MKCLFTIIAVSIAFTLSATTGGTFSLLEINPLHGSSALTASSDSARTFYGAGALSGFTGMGGKLYFAAQATPGDDELWVTDGTGSGTYLIKAINPGHGAVLGNLVLVNNHILFMASDNGTDWDLWSTDGTNTGTVKIDELNAPSNTALGPNNVSVMGNNLIFCAQQKLLRSNGTVSGTDSLLSIANYSQGFGYCELNGKVYFILPEVSGNDEIWSTDGTGAGTQWLADLSAAPHHIASANEMLSFDGMIYLSATDSGQSTPSLYTYDGLLNGQITRVPIGTGGYAYPHGLRKYNNTLYFIATDSLTSNLYKIDIGHSTPVPLIPGSTFTSLSNLTFANNTAYTMEPGGKQIHTIELTGFTCSALNLTGYHLSDFPDRNKEFLVGANGQVFFEAYDSASNNQVLMQSDLTGAGTQPVMPVGANTTHPFNSRSSGGIQDVFDLQMWGSKVIVPANFNNAGRELWIYDPAGTNGVAEIKNEGSLAIYPNPAVNVLTVKVTPCSTCEKQINVINTDGQTVMQKTLQQETTIINLPSLSSGVYMVTITEDGKVTGTKKLAVLR